MLNFRSVMMALVESQSILVEIFQMLLFRESTYVFFVPSLSDQVSSGKLLFELRTIVPCLIQIFIHCVYVLLNPFGLSQLLNASSILRIILD